MANKAQTAFALYDEANRRYLSGGMDRSPIFETTDNPLRAHLYTTSKAASQRASVIMKGFDACIKHYSRKRDDGTILKDPVLVVHQLENPTITTAARPQPSKKKSGFVVKLRIEPISGKHSGHQQAYDSYIRNRYSMVARIADPKDYYYGKMHEVLSRGSKPSIYKTERGAQNLLNKVKPFFDTQEYWVYTGEVVPYSE